MLVVRRPLFVCSYLRETYFLFFHIFILWDFVTEITKAYCPVKDSLLHVVDKDSWSGMSWRPIWR